MDRYGMPPTYPAYQMAQSILGLKIAWEKARGKGGTSRPPTRSSPRSRASSSTARGHVKMAIGDGHQGIQDTAYGTYRFNKQKNEPELVDIMRFPAECVNPPADMKADEWIKDGMKGAKCERVSSVTWQGAAASRRGADAPALPARGEGNAQRDRERFARIRRGLRRADRLRDPDRRPRLRGLSVHRRGWPDADLRRDEDPERHARLVLRVRRLWRGDRGRHLLSTRGLPDAAGFLFMVAPRHADRPADRPRCSSAACCASSMAATRWSIVLVTYAIFLILEDVIVLIWGPRSYSAYQPMVAAGNMDVGDLILSNYDIGLVVSRRCSRSRAIGR